MRMAGDETPAIQEPQEGTPWPNTILPNNRRSGNAMLSLFVACVAGTIAGQLLWYRLTVRRDRQRATVARIRVTAVLGRPHEFPIDHVNAARTIVAGEQALTAFETWPPRIVPTPTAMVPPRTPRAQPATMLDLTGPERHIIAEFFPTLSIQPGHYVRMEDDQ